MNKKVINYIINGTADDRVIAGICRLSALADALAEKMFELMSYGKIDEDISNVICMGFWIHDDGDSTGGVFREIVESEKRLAQKFRETASLKPGDLGLSSEEELNVLKTVVDTGVCAKLYEINLQALTTGHEMKNKTGRTDYAGND